MILVIVEVGPLLRSGVTWVVGLEWGDNGYWKIRWSLWRVCNTTPLSRPRVPLFLVGKEKRKKEKGKREKGKGKKEKA